MTQFLQSEMLLHPINEQQGADIASASTVNLTTATGNYVNITGTTAITAITLAQGARRTVKFAGALTLTNGASLILPGGANITTAAGDTATFIGEAAGVVRCVQYQLASGLALVASPSTDLYYRLNAAVAGANVTTVQSLFGVGVTLAASTVYEFDMQFTLLKTAGATSHTVSLLFGGTATINNIGFETWANNANSAIQTTAGVGAGYWSAVTANAITAAITQTTQYVQVLAKGAVSVNAAGTFIPQYQLSAAPGGAYSTQIGATIRFRPLGAAGANSSAGTWA